MFCSIRSSSFRLIASMGIHSIYKVLFKCFALYLQKRPVWASVNDAAILNQVYAVTKERGVHPLLRYQLTEWIWEMINDKYYRTLLIGENTLSREDTEKIRVLIKTFSSKFTTVENGMILGTVASRFKGGFITTGRGKRELDDIIHVIGHDYISHEIIVDGTRKASLNAPLLARIFGNLNVEYIVHYHEQEKGLPAFPYAPPGTVRDTNRPNETSFNIQEHGCMLLFDKDGKRL